MFHLEWRLMIDAAMGFCIYNNVGVAAKWALQKFPRQLRRILIIDWDVQFDPIVDSADIVMAMELRGYSMKIPMYCTYLFIAMMMGRFVPPTSHSANLDPFTGSPYNVGSGPGVGKNVNITWNKDRDRPSLIPVVRSDN